MVHAKLVDVDCGSPIDAIVILVGGCLGARFRSPYAVPTVSREPLRLAETIEIEQPASTVWRVIADYDRDAEWRTGLSEMIPDPPGPPHNGTRVHEVLRTVGRTYVTDTVVSEVENGTSGDVAGRRIVRPLGANRSSFTYEIELKLRGATRLVHPLVARIMRSSLRKDLMNLQGLLAANDTN